MQRVKKYTYQDWWSGKVCLELATLEYNLNIVKTTPVTVGWDKITKKDILKIKKKQRQLFSETVTKTVAKWQEYFQDCYRNSKLKNIFFKKELDQFEEILFYKFEDYQTVILTKNWNLVFQNYELQAIQTFIDNYIVKGRILEFDFVHSPNCVYQKKDKLPSEIFAQSCWDYFEWLIEFGIEHKEIEGEHPETDSKRSKQTSSKDLEEEKDSKIVETSPPPDPHLVIFKDKASYNFFLAMKDATVNEKSKRSDYGFIYFKLIAKEIGAIREHIRHKPFISYLNEHHDALFDKKIIKLPCKNPKKKLEIFEEKLLAYKAEVKK